MQLKKVKWYPGMNLFMYIMYYVYSIHYTYVMRLYAAYINQTKNLDFGLMLGATDNNKKHGHFKY